MLDGAYIPKGVDDTFVAIRNALMLGGSLVATWSVALLVRLFLPRHLGPALFGTFNFADTLAATCFVFTGLGLSTYIQKEVPVRPHHATDFFGGVLAVRVGLSALLFVAMALLVWLGGRSLEVQRAVFIFGVSQLLVIINGDLAALLHASRRVGRLAVLNVVSKIVWGGGIAVALSAGLGLEWLALASLVSEALRSIVLWRLARAHLELRMKLDVRALKAVVASSFPYYLNALAFTLYAKVDISIMAFVSSDEEIGWYGSAQNFAAIAMLIAPLIGWVIMPQFSRAASRSTRELGEMLRRSIEWVISLSIPISLLMGLGADVWVRYVFGPAFTPAMTSVRVLAPIFVLTYLAMLTATYLIMVKRAWAVTLVSFATLVLNALMNVLLVRWAQRLLGEGGAGATAASISILTEALVVAAFLAIIGKGAFDRRSVLSIGKSLAACLVVAAMDWAIRPLGPARLLLDIALYVALVVSSNALRVREMFDLIVAALAARRGNARS